MPLARRDLVARIAMCRGFAAALVAHAHTFVPAVAAAVSGTDLQQSVAGSLKGSSSCAGERLRAMDQQGIDIEVLSINPYWYERRPRR